jgi:hypothetical protein
MPTTQFVLDLTFRRRAIGGTARVNDDESTEVGWFGLSRRISSRQGNSFRS